MSQAAAYGEKQGHNIPPDEARVLDFVQWFLKFFLPALFILLAIAFAALHFDAQEKFDRLQITEAANVEMAASAITQDFESVTSDLLMLSNNPDLLRYLDSNTAAARSEVERNLLVLSREKGWYDQVRYLDADGMEVMRVDYNHGAPAVVSHAGLQNKAGRYYFKDAIKLQRGEVFVSPLDLNIEHGKIEIPYKPMIRFGTPVFDSSGHKKGIVLLNYYGARLIDHFKRITAREGNDAMLLNRDGYWLSGSAPEDEWGFMFDKQRSFAHAYPQEWKTISSTRQGSIQTPDGLFTTTTIFPLLPRQHSTTGSSAAAGSSARVLQGDEYYWKIVSRLPPDILPNASLGQHPVARMILFGTLLLAALGSLYLASAWTARRRSLKMLAESEARWSFALEGAGDGVWDWNLQTGEVVLSKAGKAMFGYAENEIGNNIADWNARLNPEDQLRWQEMLRQLFHNQEDRFSLEYRVRCKDGSYKWIYTRGMVVSHSAEGRVVRMIGVHTDLSRHKQAEVRLQLAASVFSHAREGITITDADGSIIEVNDAFTRITGYSREEVLGRNPRIFQSGRQGPEFYAAMWQALTGKGYWCGEIWNRRKSGEVYVAMTTISAVRDADGKTQNYVSLFSDITSIKEHQKQLEHIAHYDVLTGLANRVLLADRLQQAIVQSQRHKRSLAVAYLDLDGFKAVNDQYGHNVGDELLIAVAQRMKAALREVDTLARIGGDEFIVLLIDLEQPQDYEPVVARLLQAAADPLTVSGIALQVSASIGVTLYPQDAADADLLMRHADQAMYVVKQSGKNRYHVFDVAQDAAATVPILNS